MTYIEHLKKQKDNLIIFIEFIIIFSVIMTPFSIIFIIEIYIFKFNTITYSLIRAFIGMMITIIWADYLLYKLEKKEENKVEK